jgi:hypothetical protein
VYDFQIPALHLALFSIYLTYFPLMQSMQYFVSKKSRGCRISYLINRSIEKSTMILQMFCRCFVIAQFALIRMFLTTKTRYCTQYFLHCIQHSHSHAYISASMKLKSNFYSKRVHREHCAIWCYYFDGSKDPGSPADPPPAGILTSPR